MPEAMQFALGWTERLEEIERRLEAAMRSSRLGPFERDVLAVIAMHRGCRNPVASESIAAQLHMEWCENSRRAIAGAVENLVLLEKVPIGGRRGKPHGYFLVMTAEDLDLAIHARWSEVYAHLRYLRALTSKSDVARLFGQGMLQLDRDGKEAA